MQNEYDGVLLEDWSKEPNSRVWWTAPVDSVGEQLFSFDRKKIYNLFEDYPGKLTAKEKKIFEEDEPYWADFFRNRQ